MPVDLSGEIAVVTGGARGLGRAIVTALRQAGARVAAWDLQQPVQPDDADELAVTVDVTDEAAVQRATQLTLDRFGGLSVLVNNAGIAGPHRPVWELTAADWRRVVEVNLTGAFLCCRSVIPTMRACNYGRIVNIASVAGKEGNACIAAYAASKAGLIALTKTLGKELAETEIRVNCITPGAIRTAIFDGWPEHYVQSLLAKIPLRRFGQPEELASMTAWLSSRETSFSTGAVFDLSGGRATY
jgi:2-dehydro-3-deoxy-L-rhamnonate dehydrogenase (NAD+)